MFEVFDIEDGSLVKEIDTEYIAKRYFDRYPLPSHNSGAIPYQWHRAPRNGTSYRNRNAWKCPCWLERIEAAVENGDCFRIGLSIDETKASKICKNPKSDAHNLPSVRLLRIAVTAVG